MSNFSDCLTKPGGVDFSTSLTYRIKLRPQGGAVPIIPIRSGEELSTMTTILSMPHGVLPLTPVLLTCHGVLDVHAPPYAASANISSLAGVRSVGGVNLIVPIPGFVYESKTGTIQQLNHFCSQITLLVGVTVSGLLCKIALCTTHGRYV